ncbi:sensor histidine kinase [Conexibacter sp. JD483]|uniref:sensor histidine kinase n=1 Tax=unclassified Conexibacter TaxID=2627773 RepID=UPI002715F10B|nr:MULTISPECIES: sensor histidine kinase [unclassified Conexibacter]MDO8189108.1 sensor histidine kinase [Conexibacter sp. CPCC 205706]MDO8200844.1 sensor histidine kinase [Conexibacter sp. CPCC 205762]MDR9371723.1 sensor histidine kinase [Conexibacter sp. JD483]
MTEQTYDEPTMAHPPTMRLRPLGAATARRWWRDFAFHSVGSVTSVVGFTLWVTAVSITLSLLIFVIGLFVALASFYCFRWFARLERRRAALVLDGPIGERYRDAPRGSGWFQKLKFMSKDPATWKDFTWCLLAGTIGFAISWLALILWGLVVGLVTLPAWYWALPADANVGLWEVDTLPRALLTMLVGIALVPVCGWLSRLLTIAELAMMRPLLRPSRQEQLSERVEVLTRTRAGAVNAQAAELQRIERDLHDGAQARLVALALNLGMAEDKFDSDPEQARELLAEARGEAKTALTELRDLARGIHPPILSDRGLESAVTALAARSPLAVTIEAELPARLPPAVEAAAYFVVAEALANATKHSRALRVLVRLTVRGERLVVEVADDGVGGADPDGSGLVGLRRRIEALDGELHVVSPRSSGTTLHAEVPCGT